MTSATNAAVASSFVSSRVKCGERPAATGGTLGERAALGGTLGARDEATGGSVGARGPLTVEGRAARGGTDGGDDDGGQCSGGQMLKEVWCHQQKESDRKRANDAG